MSSLNQGLWRAAQNSKIPGPSLVLSYRVSGITAPIVGTGAQLVQLPATASNPAQYTQTQAPGNFAITSSPTAPNNEPQQGLSLLVTQLIVRDANGVLFGGSTGGSPTNTVISLIDQNYNSSGAWTSSSASGFTPNAAAAANTVIGATYTTGTALAAAPAGGRAPYVLATLGSAVVDSTAADLAGLVVINPYDQLAINIVAPQGTTAVTVNTATGFTVDVIGLWLPAV